MYRRQGLKSQIRKIRAWPACGHITWAAQAAQAHLHLAHLSQGLVFCRICPELRLPAPLKEAKARSRTQDSPPGSKYFRNRTSAPLWACKQSPYIRSAAVPAVVGAVVKAGGLLVPNEMPAGCLAGTVLEFLLISSPYSLRRGCQWLPGMNEWCILPTTRSDPFVRQHGDLASRAEAAVVTGAAHVPGSTKPEVAFGSSDILHAKTGIRRWALYKQHVPNTARQNHQNAHRSWP